MDTFKFINFHVHVSFMLIRKLIVIKLAWCEIIVTLKLVFIRNSFLKVELLESLRQSK